jgi:hypothetical protein
LYPGPIRLVFCPVHRALCARGQPSCPTIVITSGGAAGPGLAGLAPPANRLRGNLVGRRGGPPNPFTGREEIVCPPSPLWTLLLFAWEARLSGKLGRGGIQRHLFPRGTGPIGNEWLLSFGLCACVHHARKETRLLSEPGISLRSDASTQVPLSAGQHVCLARPSLGFGRNSEGHGFSVIGEGAGDE